MAKTTIHHPSEIEVGKIYESTRHPSVTYLGVGRYMPDYELFKTLIILECSDPKTIGKMVVEPKENEELWGEGFSLIQD